MGNIMNPHKAILIFTHPDSDQYLTGCKIQHTTLSVLLLQPDCIKQQRLQESQTKNTILLRLSLLAYKQSL